MSTKTKVTVLEEFNEQGLIVYRETSDCNVSRWEYNEKGLVIMFYSSEEGSEGSFNMRYNEQGLMTYQELFDGSCHSWQEWEYNDKGLIVQHSSQIGEGWIDKTIYSYDQYGQLIEKKISTMTNEEWENYRYDGGLLIHTEKSDGSVMDLEYNDDGRVSKKVTSYRNSNKKETEVYAYNCLWGFLTKVNRYYKYG